MGLFDNRNKYGDISMTLDVTAGKENLKMGLFKVSIKMAQRSDGLVYFDTLPGQLFQLADYSWDGPVYKTVTKTVETAKTRGREKGKEKRKGGLGGAVVGTLLMPGVGTAIGYAMTSKKVSKGKNRSKTRTNTIVDESAVEADGTARIQIVDSVTGETITFGIRCNSSIDVELDRFDWSSVSDMPEETTDTSTVETEKVKILKEYKNLLDMGVISEDEFKKKKAEILG